MSERSSRDRVQAEASLIDDALDQQAFDDDAALTEAELESQLGALGISVAALDAAREGFLHELQAQAPAAAASPADAERVRAESALVDRSLEQAEFEASAGDSEADLEAGLRAQGQDPGKLDALRDRVRADRPPANIVPIASRARFQRATWLAAAAVLLLVLGAAFVERDAIVAFFAPTPVPVPTLVPPQPSAPRGPPPEVLAEAATLRAQAVTLCEQNHFGACLDFLDRAQKLDPDGDRSEDVTKLRAYATGRLPKRFVNDGGLGQAKPPIHP